MPVSHGSKAVFKLGTSGTPATPSDITTYCSKVDAPGFNLDSAEVSTLGSTAKSYVVGLSDSSIQFEGPFHPTIDAQLQAILGVSGVAFEYAPQGTTTGLVKYTGLGFIKSYKPNTPVGDAATWQAEYQVSGAVTRAVY